VQKMVAHPGMPPYTAYHFVEQQKCAQLPKFGGSSFGALKINYQCYNTAAQTYTDTLHKSAMVSLFDSGTRIEHWCCF
jgi:hypothetical protein